MNRDVKLLRQAYEAKQRESAEFTARATQKSKRLDDGTPAGRVMSMYILALDTRRCHNLDLEYAMALGETEWNTLATSLAVLGETPLTTDAIRESLAKADKIIEDTRKLLDDMGITVRHVTR